MKASYCEYCIYLENCTCEILGDHIKDVKVCPISEQSDDLYDDLNLEQTEQM